MTIETVHKEGATPVPTQPVRILAVDDEILIVNLLSEILTMEGYQVVKAGDGNQAIALLEVDHFDLVITDIVMPGVNGIDVLMAVKRLDPLCPVVVITGQPSVETVVRLVRLGASDYIPKPFNTEWIKLTVAKLLEMKRTQEAAHQVGSLNQMPTVDAATSAYNLALFDQLLGIEIGRSRRREYVFSLLMVEIENMESYVARRGDPEEQDPLMTFVKILRYEVRPGDIIGRTDAAEFGLILPETGRSDASEVARRLRKNAEAWNLAVTAGIVCFPRDETESQGLVKTARASIRDARSKSRRTPHLR